ncbi:MAG TPA: Sir2 family NAD-dependent protein deacetylase [Bacteroidia bacterium]|nr:Sir2 family NAD-dependent protein deacetylase [Bacteroidia bacterium]HNS11150.1 Sir2 family NAD-dependent protein deacetylase [Bacteroidia bacterium]
MKNLVVFTGAGVSAESGIQTFRDGDGLWEKHRIEDVATPEAWHKNAKLVLDFYNHRRRQVVAASPNAAHIAIAGLETYFSTYVITQNIDDLHERAGSRRIVHLHGEITKARSSVDESLIYDIGGEDILVGQTCELGSQLRPHIVWFGEVVSELEVAAQIMSEADYLLVVGTSLAVYPAAGLIHYVPPHCKKFLVDPKASGRVHGFTIIQKEAGIGVPQLVEQLLEAEK